jgi:uncharacterized protein YfaS (alpha-2-macroglobulin family)
VLGSPVEAERSFDVDEYVLPKFEVNATTTLSRVASSGTLAGAVTAQYTYGEMVQGNVALQVCVSV